MAGMFGEVTPVQNTLLDAAAPYLAAAKYQLAQNSLATGQQDLADRATQRGLAAGLATRDPNALATAASLGAPGPGAVTALSNMDAQTAASKLNMLQFSGGLPNWSGTAPTGVASAAGAAAAAGGTGSGAVGGTPVSGGFSDLTDAVHQNESSGSMRAGIYGDGGQAAGPMQVHPGALADVNQRLGTNYTHAQLAAEPAVGMKVGETYLHMLQEQFGRPDYALGAYNAGPGAMRQAIASGKGLAGLSAGAQAYVAHGLSAMHAAGHSDTLAAMMNGAPGPNAPPAAPVQLASNTNTRGMPQTANDASPPGAIPVPPAPPAGGAPAPQALAAQNNDDVTAVDSADGAQSLPAGARYSVAGGAIQVKPMGGPSKGPSGMTAEQAVGQAQRDLAQHQVGMDPSAANDQVVERARQLMAGTPTPPPGGSPQSVQAPPTALSPTSGRMSGSGPAPASQPTNALLGATAPNPGAGTPQSNALLASLGIGIGSGPSSAAAPQNAPGASPAPSSATPGTVAPAAGASPGAGTYRPGSPAPGAASAAAMTRNALMPAAPAAPPAQMGGSAPVSMGNPPLVEMSGQVVPQSGNPASAPSAQPGTFSPSASAAPAAPAQMGAQGSTQSGTPAPPNYLPPGARYVTTNMGAFYTAGLPPGTGYIVNADGSRGTAPLPGTPPKVKSITVPGFIINQDERTGQVLSRTPIPDGSRMVFKDTPEGQQGFQSGHAVGAPLPFSGRPEQETAYKADIERTGAITQSVQAAQANAPRLNEMADLAQQLTTSGPGGPAFARAAAALEAMGVAPDTIKTFTGMSGGAAAQMFTKLNVQAAGADAKANVGANTGIGSINLYQTANPGLALLPDANKRITNMMRVANQATQDYGQGALQHFGQNEQQFLGGKQYAPLTAFNTQWQAQNNPQVYAAATGILNGDSFDKWRARLSSPEEGRRAAQIAARIDPNVMIPGDGGGTIPARNFLQGR